MLRRLAYPLCSPTMLPCLCLPRAVGAACRRHGKFSQVPKVRESCIENGKPKLGLSQSLNLKIFASAQPSATAVLGNLLAPTGTFPPTSLPNSLPHLNSSLNHILFGSLALLQPSYHIFPHKQGVCVV
jgi:hypothetical protein